MTSRIYITLLQVLVWAFVGLVLPTLGNSSAVTIPKSLRVIGTIEGKTYMADNETARNWTDAQAFCNSSGMRLATITTVVQATFLYERMKEFPDWHWIGGRDAQTIQQFVWDNNGHAVEPILTTFNFDVGLHACLIYWAPDKAPNGHWEADPCEHPHSFLCEIVLEEN